MICTVNNKTIVRQNKKISESTSLIYSLALQPTKRLQLENSRRPKPLFLNIPYLDVISDSGLITIEQQNKASMILKQRYPIAMAVKNNAPTNFALFLSLPIFIVVSCKFFILLIPFHFIIEHFTDFNTECVGNTESEFQGW